MLNTHFSTRIIPEQHNATQKERQNKHQKYTQIERRTYTYEEGRKDKHKQTDNARENQRT